MLSALSSHGSVRSAQYVIERLYILNRNGILNHFGSSPSEGRPQWRCGRELFLLEQVTSFLLLLLLVLTASWAVEIGWWSLLGTGGEPDTAFQVIPGLFCSECQIPRCTGSPVVWKGTRAWVDDRYHVPWVACQRSLIPAIPAHSFIGSFSP